MGQPTEHLRAVVGPKMVTEAANNRISLLNLESDRESTVAKQSRQCIQVFPNRLSTWSHQELRRRESFEPTTDKVKTIRIAHDPCFLFAQTEPPRFEKFSQLGEDDRFELPSRTGKYHEVIRVSNQSKVPEFRIFSDSRRRPSSLVITDKA